MRGLSTKQQIDKAQLDAINAQVNASNAQSHSNENRSTINTVLIVVALGFITLLLQSFYSSQAAFQKLNESIVVQNTKIELLQQQLTGVKTIWLKP